MADELYLRNKVTEYLKTSDKELGGVVRMVVVVNQLKVSSDHFKASMSAKAWNATVTAINH